MTESLTDDYWEAQLDQLKTMRGYEAYASAKANPEIKTPGQAVEAVATANLRLINAYASEGKSLFFSGAENWKRADIRADQNGMVRIKETPAGIIVDHLTEKQENGDHVIAFAGNTETRRINIMNSRAYAAVAEGQVETLVCGSDKKSIYRTTELPALLNNSKVTTINGVDRQELRDFKHQKFDRLRAGGMDAREAARVAADAAHTKVALAELRQDLAKARAAGDVAGIKDCGVRLEALRTQQHLELRSRNSKTTQQIQGSETAQHRPKSEIPIEERLQSIYDRAYQKAETQAQANGVTVSADDLAQIARTRVEQVQTKQALNRTAANLKGGCTPVKNADVKAYYERELAFRDARSQAHQRQGALLGKPNQGLEGQFKGNRALECDRRTEYFVAYARLGQHTRAGTNPRNKYAERKQDLDALFLNLQRNDARTHGVYWGAFASARHGGRTDAARTHGQAQQAQGQTAGAADHFRSATQGAGGNSATSPASGTIGATSSHSGAHGTSHGRRHAMRR